MTLFLSKFVCGGFLAGKKILGAFGLKGFGTGGKAALIPRMFFPLSIEGRGCEIDTGCVANLDGENCGVRPRRLSDPGVGTGSCVAVSLLSDVCEGFTVCPTAFWILFVSFCM